MGLRIIDRKPRSAAPHMAAYREHLRAWGEIHGPMAHENLENMVRHYQSVRQRLHQDGEANALAEDLGERLKQLSVANAKSASRDTLPHGDLDIAAVLELLKD